MAQEEKRLKEKWTGSMVLHGMEKLRNRINQNTAKRRAKQSRKTLPTTEDRTNITGFKPPERQQKHKETVASPTGEKENRRQQQNRKQKGRQQTTERRRVTQGEKRLNEKWRESMVLHGKSVGENCEIE